MELVVLVTKGFCWTNCEYKLPTVISCGGYRYPHRTKVGFSYAMGFMDNTKGQNVVNDSDERRNVLVQKLAACLWIFSNAVKNGGPPDEADDTRRRLVRDMKEKCVRIEEDHVWVSEYHLPAQEQ